MFRFSASIFSAFFAFSASLFADDWMQWRGPNHNGFAISE